MRLLKAEKVAEEYLLNVSLGCWNIKSVLMALFRIRILPHKSINKNTSDQNTNYEKALV